MAEEVRRLADDISTDLGRTPLGQSAAGDARELGQALDEFRQNRRAGADVLAVRRSYSAIQGGWEHLRSQLSAPGLATQVVARDLDRVASVNDQLSRALGMNTLPPEFYPAGANPPAGQGQTRRLARSLVDRAEGLVLAVQATLGADPRAAGLLADARALARDADTWHDSLRPGTPPALAVQAYGPVDALIERVGRPIQSRRMPPEVATAWANLISADGLLHRDLGIPFRHASVSVVVPGITQPSVVPPVVPAPPVLQLADALVVQTREFVQVFGPGAGRVPEGGLLLAEAERLAAAAQVFRARAAQGADPNSLALSFRDVDAVWQRLARRVNRIARGRTGPNIQQVAKIGATCEALHRTLGVPGFVPLVLP